MYEGPAVIFVTFICAFHDAFRDARDACDACGSSFSCGGLSYCDVFFLLSSSYLACFRPASLTFQSDPSMLFLFFLFPPLAFPCEFCESCETFLYVYGIFLS